MVEGLSDHNLSEQLPLVAKINIALQEVGIEKGIEKVPDVGIKAENLKGKSVLMIDDSRYELGNFIPLLMVVTDGKAKFVLYEEGKNRDLMSQLSESNADIILIDYNLSDRVKGHTIARALVRRHGFKGQIVGFSTDSSVSDKFKDVGALGSVFKDPTSPETSIKELNELLGNANR